MLPAAWSFPFIHDISGLAKLCREAGVPLPGEMDGADLLTPYAAGLRYDDDTVHAVERETASRWATAAVQWARGLVLIGEDDDHVSRSE